MSIIYLYFYYFNALWQMWLIFAVLVFVIWQCNWILVQSPMILLHSIQFKLQNGETAMVDGLWLGLNSICVQLRYDKGELKHQHDSTDLYKDTVVLVVS